MRFIPYGRQSIDKSDIKAVATALGSDFITQGPKVAEFESMLAGYCDAKYAVAVSSGTAALHIACLAAGLKPGDEAITTPITFAATANSILYSKAKPVFADISPVTANIDPVEIEKNITSRTKAILPVHFAGLPCEMEKIASIAKGKGIVVIEDACHALGAKYKCRGKWVKIGSCAHSDMSVFSFHPVKTITTGEGGAIVTNRRDLYDKLLAFRNHGITKDASNYVNKSLKEAPWYYEMQELGFNYRITDFQCALGISQLNRIDKFAKKREVIARFYNSEFAELKRVRLPAIEDDVISAWHLYYLKIKDVRSIKDKIGILNALRKKGIGAQVHYIPAYLHPYYKRMGYRRGLCPNAESFYLSAVSLPLYYSLSGKDMRYVAKIIKGLFS